MWEVQFAGDLFGAGKRASALPVREEEEHHQSLHCGLDKDVQAHVQAHWADICSSMLMAIWEVICTGRRFRVSAKSGMDKKCSSNCRPTRLPAVSLLLHDDPGHLGVDWGGGAEGGFSGTKLPVGKLHFWKRESSKTLHT